MITEALPVITGELSLIQDTIIGELTSLYHIEADLSILPTEFYDGDYVVIPKFAEQVLPTKNKTMQDDMVVKEIPTAEVSNPAGGLTLTIG